MASLCRNVHGPMCLQGRNDVFVIILDIEAPHMINTDIIQI